MTKVNASANCGNSPKNLFLQNLTIAFATGDRAYLLESVTGDIRWNIAGQRIILGKDAFSTALAEMRQAAEITIQHVVSHGKAGAVNGTRVLENGKTYAFCDVYEFSSAKAASVKEITSYVIEAG